MKQIKCIFRGDGAYVTDGIYESRYEDEITDTLIVPVSSVDSIESSYGITDIFLPDAVLTIFDQEAADVLNAMRGI